MLLNEKKAKKITDKILSFVKADDAQVSVSSEKYSHLRFARNAFLTSGNVVERGASITVWVDKKRGSSSTTDFDDASLKAMVEEAEEIAKISPVDRQYLPTLGQQKYKGSNRYSKNTEEINLKNRAKSVSEILKKSDKAGVISAGFHEARAFANGFATKNKNFSFEKSTYANLSMTARTPDGKSSGYFSRSQVNINDLDTERIANESIRKAVDGKNARTVDAGVYPVILEPQAVADLLGRIIFQFNARRAEEGRSPFSLKGGKTKLGQQIFDKNINILSDPWNSEIPASQTAQAGLPSEKIYLVKNGVLENLTYSRFWAKRKNTKATAGPVNTILESSGKASSLDEIIKGTKKALLIGRFWYIRTTDARTASVTGLTRDGVWMVENGKIAYPVKNFRFNQSMIQMLAQGNVEMIGNPERVGGGRASLMPALKLKGFNFTSQSEAV